jgi:hypothetical protein
VFAQTERRIGRQTPFRDRIDHRAIVFVGPSYLSADDELPALVKAMRAFEENAFYVTALDAVERDSWLVNARWVAAASVDDYGCAQELPPSRGSIASAFYSTRGNWGVWVDDFTGFVGSASREFVETFLAHLPQALVGVGGDEVLNLTPEDMPAGWVRLCRFMRAGEDFVIPTLEHIYGTERARELLLEGTWYDGAQF